MEDTNKNNQKVLERTYGIDSDGCVSKEAKGPNKISLRMDANNTLMIASLNVTEISIEIMMKAMLMAHTEFLTNYVMPKFTSELETRNESGVIDRISNLPGRGVTRSTCNNERLAIGVAAAVAAVAASGAANVASEAATAAASAAAAVIDQKR